AAAPAGGPRRRARRRSRGSRLARAAARGTGVAAVSGGASPRPLCALRRVPLQDRYLRAGTPAEGRLPARGRGPSWLDGPVRGDPRAAAGAALLVPGQWAVDVHLALAGAAHAPPRRAAAGVARRHRGREPRAI